MRKMRPIYLDYNATTPVDPHVRDAMLPYLSDLYGNASSAHVYGAEAHGAVSRARVQVADFIAAHPDDVVFTGGGSESDNLAIKGTVFARLGQSTHVVTAGAEHPAVLQTLAYLQRRFAVRVTVLPVDARGRVDPDEVRSALCTDTVLVSIMHANNEVGTLNPIEEIGRIAREAGVLFHVDAAQSAGKVQIDVHRMSIDLLTLVGHKLYAPKGVGALYIRRGVDIDPLVHGSGQESGRRAGTENVAGAAALGEACAIAAAELADEARRLCCLRDRLQYALTRSIPGVLINGHHTDRLPNTLNVSFPGVSGATVLECTPEVAASTGAACHSREEAPSGVLQAMGLSAERARGAVRLSLGRMTTDDEIERAGRALVAGYELAASIPA